MLALSIAFALGRSEEPSPAIPMAWRQGLLCVAVTLMGSRPSWLLLDTGCHRSFLTRAAYARLVAAGAKVEEGGSLLVEGAQVGGYDVGSLRFGDETMEYTQSVDGAADGYLGMDFLAKYQVGLDLREKTLRLWPAKSRVEGWFTAAPEDVLTLPLRERAEGWCVPVELGNLTVPMVVDTGASQSFLHADVAALLTGTTKRGSATAVFYDGRRKVRSYAVRDVGLGALSFGERTIDVADVPRMVGLFGRDLLSPLKVLLDYPGGQAHFVGMSGDPLPPREGPQITLTSGIVVHAPPGVVATVPLGATYTVPNGYRESFRTDGTISLVPVRRTE